MYESLALALGMSEKSRLRLETKLFSAKIRRELMLKMNTNSAPPVVTSQMLTLDEGMSYYIFFIVINSNVIFI